ncbi:MAG TPA: glycosyltransferase family 2 protein [Candidatus Wolfebacteria bacterium]|nr:glycosyltransferase family 2 protein [Candidatus Wolfebacteria bacterium]
MKNPYLSVIIPAYNEAKNLPFTLIDVNKHLLEMKFLSVNSGQAYEIIVINDGSKDATVEIVRRFSYLIKNLRLIDNKKNHGKGWVVRQGMLEAKGDIRLFMDADNATSVDQFNKMIPHLKEGYQVVIGSRDIEGAKLIPPQPFYRRFLGNIGNAIIQVLLLPGFWDTQCGFKAFTKEAAEKIFSLTKIDKWGFDPEVLALAKIFGYKIKEIPVVWVNNPVSRVKITSYIQMLLEVFKIKWWIITKKYKTRANN